jgi:hypothetical protein
MIATRNYTGKAPDGSSFFWAQTCSAIEHILFGDQVANHNDSNFAHALESCGPHAAVNALMAVHPDPASVVVGAPGGTAQIRLPDYLCVWLNTPSQLPRFSNIVGTDLTDKLANEYRVLYATVMLEVFGSPCQFINTHTKDSALGFLKAGKALQVALVNPKHYVTIVAYDETTDEFVYVDPDDRRHPDGNWTAARCKFGVGDGLWQDAILVHG